MPKATITAELVHKDLETCPGGFVKLRRMPYGDWLHRQEIAMRMTMTEKAGRGRNNAEVNMEMQMANKAVTTFEFGSCIVEHNLEGDSGESLDFKNPMALAVLDPRVGNEIGEYIRELHEFDLGNSQTEFGGSSPEAPQDSDATN